MKRLLASIAVVVGGVLLAAATNGCTTAAVARPVPTATKTVTQTRTVVRKVPAPAPTVTVTAGAPSLPCQETSGGLVPGVITPGLLGDTSCSVTLAPMGATRLAQVTLTAPDGTTSTWNLANP